MSPEQARLLVAVLHRLNVSQDDITRTIIDDLTKSLGAYDDLGSSSTLDAGAADVGTPLLTVHE